MNNPNILKRCKISEVIELEVFAVLLFGGQEIFAPYTGAL